MGEEPPIERALYDTDLAFWELDRSLLGRISSIYLFLSHLFFFEKEE